MKNEVPDFNSWLELESARIMVLSKKDRTALIEARSYRKKTETEKWQTGTAISFFGKETLKLWSIFISDEEIRFSALKTDEGKWEISVPIFEDGQNKGIISSCIEGIENPFIEISIITAKGRIERKVFKNNPPPR